MEKNPVILADLDEISQAAINWSLLDNCTVLIAGANGFLPSYLVKALLYKNQADGTHIRVIGLVRNLAKAQKVFADFLDNDQLQLVEQNIVNPIQFEDPVDYIIHAASQASPKFYGVDPVGTLEANVLGTTNLIRLAHEKKVKSFLYMSAGEVYGSVDDSKFPIAEDTYGFVNPAIVRSCYAESKRMGENICVCWFHQYSVPAKIVRPFHTYGPGMLLDDGRVFADFVSNILHKQDLVLNSDGSAKRAFCYITDATIGFLQVMLEGKAGEPYNIGNPNEEHSILELANILTTIKPEYKLKVVFNAEYINSNSYLPSPYKRFSPNIDKAKTINWAPKYTAFEGFTRVVDSFLLQPQTLRNE